MPADHNKTPLAHPAVVKAILSDRDAAKLAMFDRLIAACEASLRLCKKIPQGHSEERVEAEQLAKAALAEARKLQ